MLRVSFLFYTYWVQNPHRNNENLASTYPFGHRYPKFCHGPCVAMTAKASNKIYETAKTHEWNGLSNEDVLFNGIMREISDMHNISYHAGLCRHLTGTKEQKIQKLDDFYSKLGVDQADAAKIIYKEDKTTTTTTEQTKTTTISTIDSISRLNNGNTTILSEILDDAP